MEEDIKDKASDLWTNATELADTYKKLALITATQKAVNISSAAITILIIYIASILILFFGALSLSWWLGDVTGSRAAGFLLGAAFFLVVMLIAVILRKKILIPFFRDLIIRKTYE